jgi:hypothetical protein
MFLQQEIRNELPEKTVSKLHGKIRNKMKDKVRSRQPGIADPKRNATVLSKAFFSVAHHSAMAAEVHRTKQILDFITEPDNEFTCLLRSQSATSGSVRRGDVIGYKAPKTIMQTDRYTATATA